MTRTRIVGTVFSVLAISTSGAVFSNSPGNELHRAIPSDTCVAVNVERAPLSFIQDLQHNGWRGIPTDGTEALYHPNCDL